MQRSRFLPLLALLILLVLPPLSWAADCQLAWDPPTTNADPEGSLLTDLAGYRLYTSAVSGQYGAPSFTYTLAQLEDPAAPVVLVPCDSLSFWVLTAVDTTGNESAFSNEVAIVIADTTAPGAPVLRLREVILKLGP